MGQVIRRTALSFSKTQFLGALRKRGPVHVQARLPVRHCASALSSVLRGGHRLGGEAYCHVGWSVLRRPISSGASFGSPTSQLTFCPLVPITERELLRSPPAHVDVSPAALLGFASGTCYQVWHTSDCHVLLIGLSFIVMKGSSFSLVTVFVLRSTLLAVLPLPIPFGWCFNMHFFHSILYFGFFFTECCLGFSELY